MRKEMIEKYIESVCPLDMKREIEPSLRFTLLAMHYPELAADTLLRKEVVGKLRDAIDKRLNIIEANLEILSQSAWEKICQTFIEIVFNLVGMESKRVGFSEEEVERTLRDIVEAFKKWERTQKGKSALEAAIEKTLQNMKQVLKGNSMIAKMAENIEKNLDKENLSESFVGAIKKEIQDNIYYKMVEKGMSKFGNDSATGLRIVRHFDFVQVSSNPVIAARAYEEFPHLWDNFREIVKVNPQWQEDPEKYGDEIALHGTITSLLPNLLIFRPLALLSDFHDGLVSYQLNPFKATDAKASIADAERICSILREILYHYDAWLGWDPDKYHGRPNVVFKVAACHPAAIKTTVGLNRRGIGTNNTVTFSVSQEIRLLIAETEGMAQALKQGILPSQVYQTNMIGRTEDHLREAEAEKLLAGLDKENFEKLVQKLCPDASGTREEKTKTICKKKYLKSLTDQRLLEVLLSEHCHEGAGYSLNQLENAIEHSGIFVTRKVYKLFFAPENMIRWKAYLQRKYSLSEKEAELVLDRIDMLPASKRRAQDTYLVLGTPNVTNTEFPNHQLDVWAASLQEGFELERYKDSIKAEPNSAVLKRLLQIEDFIKIYELTPDLVRKLKEVGIKGDFGKRGMVPKDWPKYGAVQKTMAEFKNAYLNFKQKAVEFVRSQAVA